MTVKDLKEYLQNYSDDMEVKFLDNQKDITIRGLAKFFTPGEDKEFVGLYE